MRQIFGSDARAVVLDSDSDGVVGGMSGDFNICARRIVLDGVVEQDDEDFGETFGISGESEARDVRGDRDFFGFGLILDLGEGGLDYCGQADGLLEVFF